MNKTTCNDNNIDDSNSDSTEHNTMRISTNLKGYENPDEISEDQYNKITKLEIFGNMGTNPELIANLSHIVDKFKNLKKITVLCHAYNYLSLYYLFDLDHCIFLYNYITNKENIATDEYEEFRSEYLFITSKIEINYKADVVEQLIKFNNQMANIKNFYYKISFLNIEILEVDYFVKEFFNFTTLKELRLTQFNQNEYFKTEKEINIILTNNKNLEYFVIEHNSIIYDRYEDYVNYCNINYKNGITDKKLKKKIFDDYENYNRGSKCPECDICMYSLKNLKNTEIYKNPEVYLSEQHININHDCINFNFDKLSINDNIKEIYICKYSNASNFLLYSHMDDTVKITSTLGDDNLILDRFPHNIFKLILSCELETIFFADNLPITLQHIYVNNKTKHNLDKVKKPLNLEIFITK